MMNITPITPKAIEILKSNPYVANVSEKTIRFSAEFKRAFWEKYKRGIAAPLVLEQLGIDPSLLGESRVAGIMSIRTQLGHHSHSIRPAFA